MSDADSKSPVPSPQGGSVEPARAPARERDAPPAVRERYELHDPFAEATYRDESLGKIIAKADELRSNRFTAVAPNGERTSIRIIKGQWQRPDGSPLLKPREVAKPGLDLADPSTLVRHSEPETPGQPDAPPQMAGDKGAKAANIQRVEALLMERYVIKRPPLSAGDVQLGKTEYRFKGDTSRVAFTETRFKLSTDTSTPSVARSMVDLAEARGWRALRVSGAEDFRRMVWLEASVRGVKAIGYEPNAVDQELLQKERDARQTNRIEPFKAPSPGATTTPPDKPSAQGGGRKSVLAAIEAILVAKRVPEKQRQAVMLAAAEKLTQRVREGQTIQVKVYDKSAQSHRPLPQAISESTRAREHAAPTR